MERAGRRFRSVDSGPNCRPLHFLKKERIMKTKANSYIAALIGASFVSVASADVLVSNLNGGNTFNATTSASALIYNPVYVSQFVTGSDASVVINATARLYNASGYGLATYEAYIYTDDGVSPGSLIATFDTTPTIADGGGIVNVSFASVLGISLDPNTAYWFGVRNTTGLYTGWQATGSNAESSTAGWTIDDDAASLSTDGGSSWQDFSNSYGGKVFKYSFDGDTVPTPGTLALLGAGGAIASRRRRG